jgi:hypothetical protein
MILFAETLFTLAISLARQQQALTHHVFFDEPGTRTARAMCGTLIDRSKSVPNPTCPTCCAQLEAYESAVIG